MPEFETAPHRKFAEENAPKPSKEKKASFDIITSDVYSVHQSAHFIDGHGGSGGPFMYNALLADARGMGLGESAVSSPGIDALLLRGGRTAQSKLKTPVRVPKESICAVQKGLGDAQYLAGISLIIWDDAPMAHWHLAERLGRSPRDIREEEGPFG